MKSFLKLAPVLVFLLESAGFAQTRIHCEVERPHDSTSPGYRQEADFFPDVPAFVLTHITVTDDGESKTEEVLLDSHSICKLVYDKPVKEIEDCQVVTVPPSLALPGRWQANASCRDGANAGLSLRLGGNGIVGGAISRFTCLMPSEGGTPVTRMVLMKNCAQK